MLAGFRLASVLKVRIPYRRYKRYIRHEGRSELSGEIKSAKIASRAG